MSTDSTPKFEPNPSQGDFWGGSMLDGFLYKFLVFFAGLVGLDKVALRSPLTAAAKFLVNITTLGSWWVYDMIQSYTDGDFVAKYGFSSPFGPSGHGYNMVDGMSSLNKDSSYKPSTFGLFLYILYVIGCILYPLGLNSVIAGDWRGGGLKLLTCMAILPIPWYFFMGFVEAVQSDRIEKNGVPRSWPLVYPGFMLEKTHPASFILPAAERVNQEKVYTDQLQAKIANKEEPFFQGIVTSTVAMTKNALNNWPPFKAFQTVGAAADGVQAASDTMKTVATAVQQEVSKNPQAVVSKVLGLSVDAKNPSHYPSTDPASLTFSTSAVTPEVYQKMQTMKGGALPFSSEMDTLLIVATGVLVLGGFAAAFFRKRSISTKADDNDSPSKTYERDDAPPIPGRV